MATGRGKVMIVDDEPDVLESTAMMVQSLGYTPVKVDDPSQVVDTAEAERPGIILQDLRMPGLNLAGLVAALRLNPKTADIPLVFFSAHTDVAATAGRHDAWGHLSKPFAPQELERLLDRAFADSRGSADVAAGDLYRDVRAMFHEQWNLISALGNYLSVLSRAQDAASVERARRGMQEVLLKLESKTDRLQSYVLNAFSALEPVGKEGEGASRRPARNGRPPSNRV
jgi:FixJ family two-component response regulator